MSESDENPGESQAPRKDYSTPELKVYDTPTLTCFGDLRDVSKGQYAFSLEEGTYQEMNPPSQ